MKIDIFDIFCMGVDYGQLLMEQERDSEDWADAFQGCIISDKYSMPSQIAPRRQPHSDKWREAKLNSYKKFLDIIAQSKMKDKQLELI
ncbi:MAG: hypothetical protein ACK5MH_08965 [Bacteroidales bacterium]